MNHLGLQVDSDEELEALRAQAEQADLAAAAEKGVNCCYAKSNKYWYTDPTGVAWETYHSLGQVEFFGDEHVRARRSGLLRSGGRARRVGSDQVRFVLLLRNPT